MPVYKLTKESIVKLPETTFAQRGVKERADLQRLLKSNISVVAEDVLVIAEEFHEWEDADRRIDLLAVDTAANLVVIELKRDDKGGHMELQAVRYAAMVAKMTFARAVEVYQAYLDKTGAGQNAKEKLLGFLEWEEPSEEEFADDVRIVLVSADFSRELMTAVFWLNEHDLDIRCVRLKPYDNGEETIIDAQQVVPLPEAEDYMVKLKAKDQAAKAEGEDRHRLRREFWTGLLPLAAKQTPRFKDRSPGQTPYIDVSAGHHGLRYVYAVWMEEAGVQLYIDNQQGKGEFNKAVFDYLQSKNSEIEHAYGGAVKWERLDGKRACRLSAPRIPGGIYTPKDQWNATWNGMIDAMCRWEKALAPYLDEAVAAAEKLA